MFSAQSSLLFAFVCFVLVFCPVSSVTGGKLSYNGLCLLPLKFKLHGNDGRHLNEPKLGLRCNCERKGHGGLLGLRCRSGKEVIPVNAFHGAGREVVFCHRLHIYVQCVRYAWILQGDVKRCVLGTASRCHNRELRFLLCSRLSPAVPGRPGPSLAVPGPKRSQRG